MASTPAKMRLPAALELLWERRTKARRGPRAELTVARIVEAAIEIADADGLASVSMARVAERLGFTTMSLYRHVPTKDDLLLLVADAGLPEVPDTFAEPGDADWRAATERWCRAQLAAITARPWLAEAGAAALVMPGPRRLGWIDRGLACLEPTGLDAETRFAYLGALSIQMLGEARIELEYTTASPAIARAAGATEEEAAAANNPFPQFEAVLREVTDPQRFPAVAAALDEGLGTEEWISEDGAEAEAMIGIRLMLDGIAAALQPRPDATE